LKVVAAMSSVSEAPNAVIGELSPELDHLASDAMADWKVPGEALALVQDGKVALVKAYGQRDVDANLPVTPSTQFLIGSITKTFTASTVALPHNDERLDWTKPVRDYIPEFRLHDAVATDRVTVLDLLCHQTGLLRHEIRNAGQAGSCRACQRQSLRGESQRLVLVHANRQHTSANENGLTFDIDLSLPHGTWHRL
jgi:CubicO group peptidase (beta-lactamase class C family)